MFNALFYYYFLGFHVIAKEAEEMDTAADDAQGGAVGGEGAVEPDGGEKPAGDVYDLLSAHGADRNDVFRVVVLLVGKARCVSQDPQCPC